MTRLEVIKSNQKMYAEYSRKIDTMNGLEKAVAQEMILKWIKGANWMGGISDSAYDKATEKLMNLGYDEDAITVEFDRQMRKLACI